MAEKDIQRREADFEWAMKIEEGAFRIRAENGYEPWEDVNMEARLWNM